MNRSRCASRCTARRWSIRAFSNSSSAGYSRCAGFTSGMNRKSAQPAPQEMEVLQGTQEYSIRANWKLLVEKSFDDYHLLTTHSPGLNYPKTPGVEMKGPEKGHLLPAPGAGKDPGNGHAVIDNVNF